MKRLLLATTTILLVCLCGCTDSNSNSQADVTTTLATAPTPMPNIVFLNTISHWDYDGYDVTFFDSEGNYYNKSYDSYVSSKTILAEFESDPESFSKLEQTCDISKLQSNYQIVYELSNSEDYDLDYPTEYPDVEDDTKCLYGLYYDTDGELKQLLLHLNEYSTGIDANDARANDIYAWYEESIQLN